MGIFKNGQTNITGPDYLLKCLHTGLQKIAYKLRTQQAPPCKANQLVFFILLTISATSLGLGQELCKTWSESTQLGDLAIEINESSGISSSLQYPERLYHTNDSWNRGAEFFMSDTRGGQIQHIALEVNETLISEIDIEDMDVGPCAEGSCIFIADIGDNLAQRSEIHILIVPETNLAESANPRVLTLHYPDGPHDAEAFAVHPNGDLYILSKEVFPLKTPPAKLYRLQNDDWQVKSKSYTLELVASIDVRALSGSSVEVLSHIVTGMDISEDGNRLLILTYGEVFELEQDLSTLAPQSILSTDIPYKKIEVVTLLQQESITYTATGYGFIYSAESKGQASPLIQVMCKE
jgi:hypothetical protein